MIISILNLRGGSGKTTIATNLAYAIHKLGFKVCLVDADPQGSARDWHEAGHGEILPVIGFDRETIQADIRQIRDVYDHIVIDGAPRVSLSSAGAVRISDMVIIPVQPSPYDVWACRDIVEAVKVQQELNDGALEAHFVISRAIKNTNISRDVFDAIAEFKLPVLASRTTQSVAYPVTARDGKTVFHGVSDSSKNEISEMANEVLTILGVLDPIGIEKP